MRRDELKNTSPAMHPGTPQEALHWTIVALWVGGKRLKKRRETDDRTLQSLQRIKQQKQKSVLKTDSR